MKVKVLCLHGKYQNAKVFATRILKILSTESHACEISRGSIVTVKNQLAPDRETIETQYVCVDAPFIETPEVNLSKATLKTKSRSVNTSVILDKENDNPEKNDMEFRSWRLERFPNDINCVHDVLNTIKDALTENNFIKYREGPVGVMGFSQGAALAGLLCEPEIKKKLDFNPNFAILFSGYDCKTDLTEPRNSLQNCSTRKIHFFSERDQRVCKSLSEQLHLKLGGEIILHDQGHNVPKLFHQHCQNLIFPNCSI